MIHLGALALKGATSSKTGERGEKSPEKPITPTPVADGDHRCPVGMWSLCLPPLKQQVHLERVAGWLPALCWRKRQESSRTSQAHDPPGNTGSSRKGDSLGGRRAGSRREVLWPTLVPATFRTVHPPAHVQAGSREHIPQSQVSTGRLC